MPINREQRDLYPADWRELAHAIKAANGWQCQECGRQCRRPGELFRSQTDTLTVAHYDHVYTARAVFVACLCAGCHLRHDAQAHARARARRRRLRQAHAGQLSLDLAAAQVAMHREAPHAPEDTPRVD